MTPLSKIIAAQIRQTGPLSLADYMQICLLHPQYGYYATRDPFGQRGDFITAPEIHQMFGELCALALAQAWQDQGGTRPFALVEPGPGRGTLMADMLRTIARVPGMAEAAQPVLIETSPHLREVQRQRLGPVTHLTSIDELPEGPLFLIANEFFDALPIRQFLREADGWAERVVGLDPNGHLQFGLRSAAPHPRPAKPGDVIEECPQAPAIVHTIATRIARFGGAAIIIDYGGWNGYGDTFQALRDHRPEDPLAHPGEADLTAHVDFAPLAAAALQAGAQVSVPRHQGDWLLSLGAALRAERLAAAGDKTALSALHRLTDPAEMGHLFKVIAIWPKGAPAIPGFEALKTDAANA